jgi:RNA polymerase sigma-70 factor (ECF subfamily)
MLSDRSSEFLPSRVVSFPIDEQGPGSEITEYLRAWEQGDDGALERLLPLVYAELRSIAARHLSSERTGHTLQPTALANEAYLRLRGLGDVPWHDRTHFFAIASRIMRRILVDHARAKMAQKRGSDAPRVLLAEGYHEEIAPSMDAAELIDLDRALDELAAAEPRLARLVELRFFSGLRIEEVSTFLGISPRTAKRDWAFARAWLLNRLSPGTPPEAAEP